MYGREINSPTTSMRTGSVATKGKAISKAVKNWLDTYTNHPTDHLNQIKNLLTK